MSLPATDASAAAITLPATMASPAMCAPAPSVHLRKAENKMVHNLVPYLELAAKARKSSAEVSVSASAGSPLPGK